MKTTTTTKTLGEFLADHAICRVWFAGVGSPAGCELTLNLDDDGEGYCDSETLLNLRCVRQAVGFDLGGTVTRDADGEWRWEVDSLEDVDLTDDRGNTVYNLVVWGE